MPHVAVIDCELESRVILFVTVSVADNVMLPDAVLLLVLVPVGETVADAESVLERDCVSVGLTLRLRRVRVTE